MLRNPTLILINRVTTIDGTMNQTEKPTEEQDRGRRGLFLLKGETQGSDLRGEKGRTRFGGLGERWNIVPLPLGPFRNCTITLLFLLVLVLYHRLFSRPLSYTLPTSYKTNRKFPLDTDCLGESSVKQIRGLVCLTFERTSKGPGRHTLSKHQKTQLIFHRDITCMKIKNTTVFVRGTETSLTPNPPPVRVTSPFQGATSSPLDRDRVGPWDPLTRSRVTGTTILLSKPEL